VFENRMLRRIFGPKREEVAGDWRRLHNEELHNLYIPRNIIRMIKSTKIRWVGRVARMGEMRTILYLEKLKGRDHSKYLGLDRRIILKLILGK
jgi:hypothetical protein